MSSWGRGIARKPWKACVEIVPACCPVCMNIDCLLEGCEPRQKLTGESRITSGGCVRTSAGAPGCHLPACNVVGTFKACDFPFTPSSRTAKLWSG
jgi:hypothetical protein